MKKLTCSKQIRHCSLQRHLPITFGIDRFSPIHYVWFLAYVRIYTNRRSSNNKICRWNDNGVTPSVHWVCDFANTSLINWSSFALQNTSIGGRTVCAVLKRVLSINRISHLNNSFQLDLSSSTNVSLHNETSTATETLAIWLYLIYF